MNNILSMISGARTIGISGHVRPDGDCTGSSLALYNYLLEHSDADEIDLYLEYISEKFTFIKNSEKVNTLYDKEIVYDIFISVDSGSIDRLGLAEKYFLSAKQTINIDHHISNTNFGMHNHVMLDASSTCEVLYGLLEFDKISKDIAESLYIGIIHDTGVFKHSNTTQKTMEIAGQLISKGINFSKIIDESFYQMTYTQNQLLGRCLLESFLVLDGRCIVTVVTKAMLNFYHAGTKDLDGIIDQLRITKGVEAALLIHEIGTQQYKISMRANGDVNVSKIATYFGGGGHIKAAGCTIFGSVHDAINNIIRHLENQLNKIQES